MCGDLFCECPAGTWQCREPVICPKPDSACDGGAEFVCNYLTCDCIQGSLSCRYIHTGCPSTISDTCESVRPSPGCVCHAVMPWGQSASYCACSQETGDAGGGDDAQD
jgi:hypothetical protein